MAPKSSTTGPSRLPCIVRYGSLYEEILKHRMQSQGSQKCFPGELRARLLSPESIIAVSAGGQRRMRNLSRRSCSASSTWRSKRNEKDLRR